MVSSYPSGASLFQTILNRRSTKLWRKMPSPGDKSPSPPLLNTVWFFERPNFIEDLRLSCRGRKRRTKSVGGARGIRTRYMVLVRTPQAIGNRDLPEHAANTTRADRTKSPAKVTWSITAIGLAGQIRLGHVQRKPAVLDVAAEGIFDDLVTTLCHSRTQIPRGDPKGILVFLRASDEG